MERRFKTVEGIFRYYGKSKTVDYIRGYVTERVHEGMTIPQIVDVLDSRAYLKMGGPSMAEVMIDRINTLDHQII